MDFFYYMSSGLKVHQVAAHYTTNGNLIVGHWKAEINYYFKSISKQSGNNFSIKVIASFCQYFNSTGKVLWSEKYI